MPQGNVSREARTSPPVRISYPQLFTAKSFAAGQTGRFSTVLMINKKNQEQMDFLKELHKDAQACLVEKWPDESKRPRIPLVGHDKSLFKDGDTAVNNQGIPLLEKNPEYAGHYILRASTTQKPQVVNRRRIPITDSNEVYGGCWCRINLNVYTFVQPQNQGVTVGLNGVQKWQDDDSFGGGRPPLDEMFDVWEDEGANDPLNYEGGKPDPFSQDDFPF